MDPWVQIECEFTALLASQSSLLKLTRDCEFARFDMFYCIIGAIVIAGVC